MAGSKDNTPGIEPCWFLSPGKRHFHSKKPAKASLQTAKDSKWSSLDLPQANANKHADVPLRIRMCRQWTFRGLCTLTCSPSNGSITQLEGEANIAGVKASEATRTRRSRALLFLDCGAPRETGKSLIPKHFNGSPRRELTKSGELQLCGDELSPGQLITRPLD